MVHGHVHLLRAGPPVQAPPHQESVRPMYMAALLRIHWTHRTWFHHNSIFPPGPAMCTCILTVRFPEYTLGERQALLFPMILTFMIHLLTMFPFHSTR